MTTCAFPAALAFHQASDGFAAASEERADLAAFVLRQVPAQDRLVEQRFGLHVTRSGDPEEIMKLARRPAAESLGDVPGDSAARIAKLFAIFAIGHHGRPVAEVDDPLMQAHSELPCIKVLESSRHAEQPQARGGPHPLAPAGT